MLDKIYKCKDTSKCGFECNVNALDRCPVCGEDMIEERDTTFFKLNQEDLEYVLDELLSEEEKEYLLKEYGIPSLLDILSRKMETNWSEDILACLETRCLNR